MESKIEARLKAKVAKAGGLTLKFLSPGTAGVPDRLVLLPGKKIFFAELKAPGEKLRPLQQKRKQQLERLGFQVYIIDSCQAVRDFMREVAK